MCVQALSKRILPLILLAGFVLAPSHGKGAQYVVAWGDDTYGQCDVPPGLTNIVAIAAGQYCSFAVRADGLVVAWGQNYLGLVSTPSGLINVTAVSAYGWHALALKRDGTVFGWGQDVDYVTSIPAGLSNVAAIATGAYQGVALLSNGTVRAWGGNCLEANIPSWLTNAVAIGAANSVTYVVRSDGTLVSSASNWTNALPGFTNVAAISVCDTHSLVLKRDGTVQDIDGNQCGSNLGHPFDTPAVLGPLVSISANNTNDLAIASNRTLVGWGSSPSGQITIPPGLTNVVAVSAGVNHSLAIVAVQDGSPVVVRHPASVGAYSGANAAFTVAAEGAAPLACQWQFNGINLSGATNFTLTLTNVQLTNSGNYQAVVSNPYGFALSLSANLSVTNQSPVILTQPANSSPGVGSTASLSVSATGSLPLGYQWHFNGTNLSGATTSTLTFSSVPETALGYYDVLITNLYGATNSSTAFLDVIGLAAALEATNLVWTTGGNSPWFVQTNYDSFFYGQLSPVARSGVITNNQSSVLQTTATGPGKLSFSWAVSSQPSVDYLAWYVNGAEQARISGSYPPQNGWNSQTAYFGAGTLNLQWIYSKGPSGSGGQDAAWLDHVTFTPGEFLPSGSVQPLGANPFPGSNVTFMVQPAGLAPFTYQWQHNGININGATNSSLTITNVQLSDNGTYQVLMGNVYGTALSSSSTLNVLLFIGPLQPQDALDRWYYRDSTPLNRVKYAGGMFIGLGANGKLMTSPDGSNWTTRATGTTSTLTGVAYGNVLTPPPAGRLNEFVAVGAGGVVIASTNGVNWTPLSPPFFQDFNDVAYLDGGFILTATRAQTNEANLYGFDGSGWFPTQFPGPGLPDGGGGYISSAIGCDAANGVAVTAGGTEFAYDIWTSFDFGYDWTYTGFSDAVVNGIAYGNGVFVMVGWEGWPRVSTDDGSTWQYVVDRVNISNPSGGYLPMVGSDINFGNGTFVVARSFLEDGILTTTNGFNWHLRPTFGGNSVVSIAYGNGTFVAIVNNGNSSYGLYPSGIYQSAPVAVPMLTIAAQAGPSTVTVTVSGEAGRRYRLQSSPDLQTWTDRLIYTNAAMTTQFVDSIAPGVSQQFYRAVSP